ncbi:MAG: hypothetical protein ACHQVS_04120 [Candidatus Babeliales bacterium]
MNKWILGVLSIVVVGTQVCVGAELKPSPVRGSVLSCLSGSGAQERTTLDSASCGGQGTTEFSQGKKPKLWVNVRVKVKNEPGHRFGKTPHHKKEVFTKLEAEKVAMPVEEPAKTRVALQAAITELELGPDGKFHHPTESLTMWGRDLDDAAQEFAEANKESSPTKRESGVLVTRAVKERSKSVALPVGDEISLASRAKAMSFIGDLEQYRKSQAQRLTLSDKQ